MTHTIRVAYTQANGRRAEKVWTTFGLAEHAQRQAENFASTQRRIGNTVEAITVLPDAAA